MTYVIPEVELPDVVVVSRTAVVLSEVRVTRTVVETLDSDVVVSTDVTLMAVDVTLDIEVLLSGVPVPDVNVLDSEVVSSTVTVLVVFEVVVVFWSG